MQQDIYSTLPIAARGLVDEIEKHSGIEIQVLPMSHRSGGWVAEVYEESASTVGVVHGPEHIVIEGPAGIDLITDEDYIHELLHLARLYVENVPHLFPRKKNNGNAAAAMENWLEHVVIYDSQLKMCPNFSNKLNAGLSEYWQRCPWNLSGSDLRFNLLSRYMITDRYGSTDTRKVMADAIQKLRLPFSIRNVARQCSNAIQDKKLFVTKVLHFCGVPTDLFWIRRYDVKNRRAVWHPI